MRNNKFNRIPMLLMVALFVMLLAVPVCAAENISEESVPVESVPVIQDGCNFELLEDDDSEIQPCVSHEWSEWRVVVKPTYENEGATERVCTVCGEEEIHNMPALSYPSNEEKNQSFDDTLPLHNDPILEEDWEVECDGNHSWYSWEVVKAPTASEVGMAVGRCSYGDCDAKLMREIPAIKDGKFDFVANSFYTKEEHSRWKRCADDAHDWNVWVVFDEPTALENGHVGAFCSECGWYVSLELEATDTSSWWDSFVEVVNLFFKKFF